MTSQSAPLDHHLAQAAAPTAENPLNECDSCGPALMKHDAAHELAECFKALADPTRVRLLELIASSSTGTACACHLPGDLGISQPTLSHHLKKLTEAGLLMREQRGRWAHYTSSPTALANARAFLFSLGADHTPS